MLRTAVAATTLRLAGVTLLPTTLARTPCQASISSSARTTPKHPVMHTLAGGNGAGGGGGYGAAVATPADQVAMQRVGDIELRGRGPRASVVVFM